MNAIKFTLLKCYTDQGLIVNAVPVFKEIESNSSYNESLNTVIETKKDIKNDHIDNSNFKLDGILPFEGHINPFVSLKDFRKAVTEYPQLCKDKLSRYFLNDRPTSANESNSRREFNYQKVWTEGQSPAGFETVTLLAKDHLYENYQSMEFLVDIITPAESILQYLIDNTDGRCQPVIAFKGSVKMLLNGPEEKPLTDPLGKTIGALLDTALIRQGFLAEDPKAMPDRGLGWLASVLKSRAMVAIETDLPFCEQTIANAIQDKISLPLVTLQPDATPELYLTFTPPAYPACVVIPMSVYKRITDPEKVAHELMRGGHSVLIGCSNVRNLPDPIRPIVEITITMPRIDKPVFEKLFKAIFGNLPQVDIQANNGDSWMQYAQPWDLARIAKMESNPGRAFNMIKHRVEGRLKRVTPTHGPSLSNLHGLGEARIRAEMMIADIKAAVDGDIPWSQVDRGMLLAGPPGCGKTALARAIAKDCGVRFVDCSASRWQMAGYLNDHLAAMAADFAEARRFEPSIMFIDEIDSIGNRNNFSGGNSSYNTQVVNALLAEVQGFSERGKVILIAATNNVENVDPALRRAGRLDRIIKVSLPTIDALEKIFEYYINQHGASMGQDSDIILRPVAEAAFGRTGADVSLAVRGAIRRARQAGRPLCQDDLMAELYERPLDRDISRPLSGNGIRRVAIHEAGHAALRIKSEKNMGRVGFISIVPRPDGSLGFVALQPNPDVATVCRNDFLTMIDIALAGRAAEQVFYGEEGIGAGSGGGEDSDLAKAMAIALDMVCRLGLGINQKPRWRSEPWDADLLEAEDIVSESYNRSLRMITKYRNLVEKIADLLVERQEVSGEELMTIVGNE